MYFPLIERRIINGNRRLRISDRRQRQRSDVVPNDKRSKVDRRAAKDRRVLKLDRETLLNAALLVKSNQPEQHAKENTPEQSKTFSFCSLILVPLAIAGSSIFLTHSINEHQAKNAKVIADQQMASAELII